MSTTTTIAPSQTAPSSSLSLKGTRSVKANLKYLDHSVEKPFIFTHDDHPGQPKSNHVHETVEVDVLDISSTTAEQRTQLGLNTEQAGFSIVDGFGDESTGIVDEWAQRKWDTPGWFESTYYHDIDALLKKHAGATSTFIFDHTVRKRQPDGEPKVAESAENRQPVEGVHVDQSAWAGANRVRKHLGEETFARVQSGEIRAQLINVWRPLRGEVYDWPLGYADSRTINPSDWKVNELRYPDWTGETLAIHSNPVHKWYYYRGLPTSKAILLKCYDSTAETRTPHTAFKDPSTPADAEPRWSVEVRVLVITDPKAKELQA